MAGQSVTVDEPASLAGGRVQSWAVHRDGVRIGSVIQVDGQGLFRAYAGFNVRRQLGSAHTLAEGVALIELYISRGVGDPRD